MTKCSKCGEALHDFYNYCHLCSAPVPGDASRVIRALGESSKTRAWLARATGQSYGFVLHALAKGYPLSKYQERNYLRTIKECTK